MTPHQNTESLLKRLNQLHLQKGALLDEMLKHTFQMAQMDELEEAEQIVNALDSRQACIEKVDDLSDEIHQLTQLILKTADEAIGFSSNVQHLWAKVHEKSQENQRLIEQVQTIDQQQQSRWEWGLAKLKGWEKELQLKKKTIHAYSKKYSNAESVFIDKVK